MKNKIISVLILAAYALVTIATSYKKDYVDTSTAYGYSVSSNCSGALYPSGNISVTETSIVFPTTITFLDLGFPTATVNIGSDVSADLAPSLTRTCTYSIQSIGPSVTSVYTCSDNGIPACTINLGHLN